MFSDATVLVSVNIDVIKTESLILQSATSAQFSSESLLLSSTVFNIFIITQAMEQSIYVDDFKMGKRDRTASPSESRV